MQAFKFKHLQYGLLLAIDSGKYDELSVDDVEQALESEKIVDLLGEVLSDFDTSILDQSDWSVINAEWSRIVASGFEKLGFERRGLCLMMALAIESEHVRQSKAA